MRKAGWILGVGASLLLGPVIYVVARLAELTLPRMDGGRRLAPVPVRVRR